jgi:hypothetical protein
MSSEVKVRLKKMPERKIALLLRLHQGLKDRLVELAKREHRSLNQQIEFLLEQALSGELKKSQNDQQGGRSPAGRTTK